MESVIDSPSGDKVSPDPAPILLAELTADMSFQDDVEDSPSL
jgi:hypothetical protein